MTKNKQPRDGNGKFTKMIKVTDKFGNNAYFTPDEMAGFKATPKNPDCEPATKGYSKSVGRTVIENSTHNHSISINEDLRCSLFVVFGIVTFVSSVLWFILGTALSDPITAVNIKNIEIAKNVVSISAPISIIGGLITFCAWVSESQPSATGQSRIFNEYKSLPKELQKYTPPRKDECEEE